MINAMEVGMRGIQMEIGMKANLRKERLMEKEFITGTQVKFTMENGSME